jgi:hypothetical protein
MKYYRVVGSGGSCNGGGGGVDVGVVPNLASAERGIIILSQTKGNTSLQ